ncbi:class I SAM-dependent methyltransferase [Kibdelosporangium aridum]|uniref:Class I SAM-dependent methyltransferase n=1 Tax=Kibdelosporangium aridum TaxID=2030 RepID=A0A428Z4P4_KIBAR|nr:class I SAM-dependent methyltransferase [Kibdelosporangium aridum]RSM81606.1 class I SAM-dependent methyltransferase [Kibdelosporangium aridum]
MLGWDAATFGDTMPDYDGTDWAIAYDEREATDFLLGFGKDGRALELGVGTGRVAIPLAESGVPTVGIEGSAAMAAQLTSKLEQENSKVSVDVVVGDFADVAVPGPFQLVYCVYNTFFLLLSQNEQVKCFRNVADVLAPGGAFVLQTFVPEPYVMSDRQHTRTLHVSMDKTVLMSAVHYPARQRVDCQQVVMTKAGNELHPLAYRYVWPSEMDLMATVAGLSFHQRWGGWMRERFTGEGGCVSVYRKPEAR